MSKHIHVFSIGRAYRTCRVYTGKSDTGQQLGTSTITVNKELTRKQRYDEIADYLKERFRLDAPPYVPTKREVGQ